MPTDSRRINGPEDSFDPSVLLVDKKTREVNILFILLICLFMLFVARYRYVSKPVAYVNPGNCTQEYCTNKQKHYHMNAFKNRNNI